MRALGRAEWIGRSDDEKLYPAMSEFLRKTFMTRSRDEWFDYLSQRDVAVARVNTIADVIADPQILHRGMMVEAGTFEGQAITQVGIGIGLTETPGAIRSIGTVRGQHTVEVLTGLGYSPEEVRGLRQRGVIE
jgi:crotonobetainyl-CoA:carnitine CoA-transferase CaiB-like acyl-CoA transferase